MTVLDPVRHPTARRSTLVPDLVAAVVATVVTVLLGAPAGLLWARVAPQVLVVPQGGEQFSYVDPETRAFLGGDVAFALVALGVGVLCGLGAYAFARRRGPGAVAGLLAGGLLAAWVAKEVGEMVGLDAFTRAVHAGTASGTVRETAVLRVDELLLAWPVGALATFAVLLWLRPFSHGRPLGRP